MYRVSHSNLDKRVALNIGAACAPAEEKLWGMPHMVLPVYDVGDEEVFYPYRVVKDISGAIGTPDGLVQCPPEHRMRPICGQIETTLNANSRWEAVISYDDTTGAIVGLSEYATVRYWRSWGGQRFYLYPGDWLAVDNTGNAGDNSVTITCLVALTPWKVGRPRVFDMTPYLGT